MKFKDYLNEAKIDASEIPFLTSEEAKKWMKKGYAIRLSNRPTMSFPVEKTTVSDNMNSTDTPVGMYGWDMGAKRMQDAFYGIGRVGSGHASYYNIGGFPVFNRRKFIHVLKIDTKKVLEIGGTKKVPESEFHALLKKFVKNEFGYDQKFLDMFYEFDAALKVQFGNQFKYLSDIVDVKEYETIVAEYVRSLELDPMKEFEILGRIERLAYSLHVARINGFTAAGFYNLIMYLSNTFKERGKQNFLATKYLIDAGYEAVRDTGGKTSAKGEKRAIYSEAEVGQVAFLTPASVKRVAIFRNPIVKEHNVAQEIDWKNIEYHDVAEEVVAEQEQLDEMETYRTRMLKHLSQYFDKKGHFIRFSNREKVSWPKSETYFDTMSSTTTPVGIYAWSLDKSAYGSMDRIGSVPLGRARKNIQILKLKPNAKVLVLGDKEMRAPDIEKILEFLLNELFDDKMKKLWREVKAYVDDALIADIQQMSNIDNGLYYMEDVGKEFMDTLSQSSKDILIKAANSQMGWKGWGRLLKSINIYNKTLDNNYYYNTKTLSPFEDFIESLVNVKMGIKTMTYNGRIHLRDKTLGMESLTRALVAAGYDAVSDKIGGGKMTDSVYIGEPGQIVFLHMNAFEVVDSFQNSLDDYKPIVNS